MNNKLFYFVLFSFLFSIQVFSQDPNFHIYLCFGQSNMEGQGTIETQDNSVDDRFQILQAVSCTGKAEETWRTAEPPLVRCYTKLGPADYFGRTMADSLPTDIKIGIVDVAVAGCKIEMFDKEAYETVIANIPSTENWKKNIVSEYGNNPYGKFIALAKLAQNHGVIKGILLHQGESNTGQEDWPTKVKKIYRAILNDLELQAENVPLLAGQVVDAGQGGACAAHNAIINRLPDTIPTAHVISSQGCTAQSDKLHFNSAGYRLLGKRYAYTMLALLKDETTIQENKIIDFVIGPNPFRQEVCLIKPLPYIYRVYSAQGNVLEYGKGREELALGNNLGTGAYLLQIIDEDGNVETVKLLKL